MNDHIEVDKWPKSLFYLYWLCENLLACIFPATVQPTTTSTTPITTTITTVTTPKPCPSPKVPTDCAPLCEEKCHFLGKCDSIIGMGDNWLCVPGCQCPNGTVWNGNSCVGPQQCPCKDEIGNVHQVTI